ncbi:hypothetical protein GCM10027259_22770 [Micromonospora palomenae]|uniref:hypothetical protein n=1 Tax=Micromonospora palomenae TaxID=1461247 RepID=UPI0012B8E4FA|nr:hypothetical protein [Micromonospora palomenae]
MPDNVDLPRPASLADLAESVMRSLRLVGVPTARDRSDPGAYVYVDESTDESGGVFVEWNLSEELRHAMMQFAAEGDLSSPRLSFIESAQGAMESALRAIVAAAGFKIDTEAVGVHEFAFKVEAV